MMSAMGGGGGEAAGVAKETAFGHHKPPPYLKTTSGYFCLLEPAEPGQPQRMDQDPEREQEESASGSQQL